MANHTEGLRHAHARKRIYQKHEPYPHPEPLKRAFDKIIYIAAMLGPIMNLPQLLRIWIEKNATGVSFISWTGFSVISVVWLIYGILHKEKPIIFMNAALMVIQALIAYGTLLYG